MTGQSVAFALVPLAGGAVAEYHGGGAFYYRHPDWIGSSRFVSTTAHTMYSDGAYGPFGEPYAGTGTSDLMWTGMDQDTSWNVYDFPAREYGIQGRWPSPDPAGLAAVNPMDPQSWNHYAYVRNSPLELTDLTGLCPVNSAYPCSEPPPAGAGPGGCTIDGNPVSCDFAGGEISSGGGLNCGSLCGIVGIPVLAPGNGQPYTLIPGVNGWEFINDLNDAELSMDSAFSDGLGLPFFDSFYVGSSGGRQSSSGGGNQGCIEARVSGVIPGAQPTGTWQDQGGHQETNFTFSGNLSTFAPIAPNAFSIFGVNNGYRFGGVFFSLHINSVSFNPSTNTTSFQGHEDVFNPATGLLGILGHTVVDLGIGTILFNHSAGLDRGC